MNSYAVFLFYFCLTNHRQYLFTRIHHQAQPWLRSLHYLPEVSSICGLFRFLSTQAGVRAGERSIRPKRSGLLDDIVPMIHDSPVAVSIDVHGQSRLAKYVKALVSF